MCNTTRIANYSLLRYRELFFVSPPICFREVHFVFVFHTLTFSLVGCTTIKLIQHNIFLCFGITNNSLEFDLVFYYNDEMNLQWRKIFSKFRGASFPGSHEKHAAKGVNMSFCKLGPKLYDFS